MIALAAPAAAPAGSSLADGLTGFSAVVVSVMETMGSPGVGLLVAAENLFPPIPSEVILPLAGFAASRGSMSIVAAIVFATLGSVVGALVLYWIGAAFGLERICRWAERMPLVDDADVAKTVAWFHRHGPKAVFFGRMVPIFRSLISIPAGIERMPLMSFTVLTTVGSLIWNSIFVGAGYLLGENWHVVEQYAGVFQRIVILVVFAAVVWWIVRRIMRNRSQRISRA